MRFEPYNYQRYCIERMVEQPRLGLFIDMGLGKTVSTLMAIRELKYDRLCVRKVLVIAPKKVAEATWTAERDKWDQTRMLSVSLVLGSEKQRLSALRTEADIYVINRENTPWIVGLYAKSFDWPFDMVVIDESSSFKNPRAKRFKALCKVLPRINRLVELSGTPSPQGLEDLWSQIYLLDQGERLCQRYTQYRERYFYPGASNGYVVYNYVPKPGAKEAITKKLSDICVTMKAEDYLDLPEMIEHTVPVKLNAKAEKDYKTMERNYVLSSLEGEEDITAMSAAALTTKLLQISAGAVYDEDRGVHLVHDCKLDALQELLESLDQQALVFYGFQHDLARICERLSTTGKSFAVLNGPETIEAWNRGEIDVLLAHPASAGYGLNLQQGGHHVVWFTPTWNYEQYVQANARLHRQGQTERVVVHLLICEGTRDEAVVKALSKKEKAQEYVIESLKAKVKEYGGTKSPVKKRRDREPEG